MQPNPHPTITDRRIGRATQLGELDGEPDPTCAGWDRFATSPATDELCALVPGGCRPRPSHTRSMQIIWAIPCRYGEQLDGLGNLLGAGLDVFFPSSIPCNIAFGLAINIRVPEDELGSTEEIRVEILDPEMGSIAGTSITFRPEDYSRRPGARQPTFMEMIPVQINGVERYGQYTLNLLLQDRAHTIPLFVEPQR